MQREIFPTLELILISTRSVVLDAKIKMESTHRARDRIFLRRALEAVEADIVMYFPTKQ
jgi:hypothetical protein